MQIPNILKTRGITSIATLDFETFYSKDYTLRKMSTSLYIFDSQFLIHGLGININGVTSYYYNNKDTIEALKKIDWKHTAILCHHTQFDALILFYHFKIKPAFYLDTLSMARPVLQNVIKKLDLDSVAKYFDIPGKLPGLEDTKDKRELTSLEAVRLGIYCKNDVDITLKSFEKLLPYFVNSELELIHYTVKMYADPKLIIDSKLIDLELINIEKHRKQMFKKVRALFPPSMKELDTITILRSSLRLEEVLIYNGITVPKKISKTTELETCAFAKTDLEFQKMGLSKNKDENLLYEARLVSKSDTARNKAIILKKFALAGCCPVYLNYWKPQTGRWSGGDKIQLQNLPRKGAARRSLLAPLDHVLLVCDLSQVELRMSAWFSEQQDVLDIFISGKDVYKDMATKIYRIPYDEVTKDQRMVAKVACLGENTQVLTNRGYIRILDVLKTDRIWDGNSWVQHSGLIFQGLKKTNNMLGISLTPDHLVYHDNGWKTSENISKNENMLRQSLDQSMENLLSQDIYLQKKEKDIPEFWLNVHAQIMNIKQIIIILSQIKQDDVQTVHARCQLKHGMQKIYALCQTIHIEQDFLIACHPLFLDVIPVLTKNLMTTENVESLFIMIGESIDINSWNTFKHYLDGMINLNKWIEEIITKGMNQEIFALSQDLKIIRTKDWFPNWNIEFKNWKPKINGLNPVYDLINCGPNNRFTILSASGPIVVHNCLGLGYGAGIATFDNMLKVGAMGPKVDLPITTVSGIHAVYRGANNKIVNTWYKSGEWLKHIAIFTDKPPISYKGVTFQEGEVLMPNGTILRYPNLIADDYNNLSYQGSNGIRRRIYSSLFYENIIQSLARHVIAEHLVKVAYKYNVVLSVHDELVVSVPFKEINQATTFVEKVMRTSPTWCSDLPLDCESGYAINYSK